MMEQQRVISIAMLLIWLWYKILLYTGGIPATGGDYVLSQDDFEFLPATNLRPCIDLFVFDDDVFEGSEDLTITVQGFVLPGSTGVTPSLPGVTINPSVATVTITDNDSEQ